MNILIIEDQEEIASALAMIFRKTPRVNNVTTQAEKDQALVMALSGIYDVLIVDIVLGEQDRAGLWICNEVRKQKPVIPLIVVTALHSVSVLSEAFEIGVNEYITKPFDCRELELRVKRWFGVGQFIPRKDLQYEGLYYDSARHEVLFRKKVLHMSKRNKALLLLFLSQPELLLTHEYIMQKYWGDLQLNPHRNIRQSISRLRNDLGSGCQNWIRVLPGEGYCLRKDNIV